MIHYEVRAVSVQHLRLGRLAHILGLTLAIFPADTADLVRGFANGGANVVIRVWISPQSVPALAWRVEIGGRSIVFSGDTNGEGAGLVHLAKNADLFIAHNAGPEGATGVERRLHMPPSVIGQIAEEARVKRLVLSHRMLRTLGKEQQTQSEISKSFSGPVAFANDLDCFPVR